MKWIVFAIVSLSFFLNACSASRRSDTQVSSEDARNKEKKADISIDDIESSDDVSEEITKEAEKDVDGEFTNPSMERVAGFQGKILYWEDSEDALLFTFQLNKIRTIGQDCPKINVGDTLKLYVPDNVRSNLNENWSEWKENEQSLICTSRWKSQSTFSQWEIMDIKKSISN